MCDVSLLQPFIIFHLSDSIIEDNYMVVKLVEINTFLLLRKVLSYFESTIHRKTQASMWQIGYCEVVYAIKVINTMKIGWLHFQTDVETFHVLDVKYCRILILNNLNA